MAANDVIISSEDAPADDAKSPTYRRLRPFFVGTIQSSGTGSCLEGRIGISYTAIGAVASILIVGSVVSIAGFLVGIIGLFLGGPGFLASLAFPVGFFSLALRTWQGLRDDLRQAMGGASDLRREVDDLLAV